jgi:hypothetical protein
MVEVLLQGAETEARDPLEATATLSGVPRCGDHVVIWDGSGEVYLEVEAVCWPAYQYNHDPGPIPPTIGLRREGGYSDEEWRDLFAAVRETRSP